MPTQLLQPPKPWTDLQRSAGEAGQLPHATAWRQVRARVFTVFQSSEAE